MTTHQHQQQQQQQQQPTQRANHAYLRNTLRWPVGTKQ